MWVILVNISSVIGPVIHEERKASACHQLAPAFTPVSLWLVSMVSHPRTADG
jgi:hypothetical protein